FLTVVTVAWGVFMLVLLQGAGNGIRNGVERQFQDNAVNSIWVFRGRTAVAHEGHPAGRRIQFTNKDYELTRDTVAGVEHITSRYYLDGEYTVSHKNRHAAFDIRSSHPDHKYIEKTITIAGRFLNDIDIRNRRKVCAIGVKVRDTLFGNTDPVGEYVRINGIQYQVVGVFEDEGREGEQQKIYVPISTAQMVYGGGDRVHQMMFTVGDAGIATSRQISDATRRLLANRHDFAVEDEKAVKLWNNLEEYQKIASIFLWVKIFVWVIGIGTVLTGILAVSNIMVISVKERTKEIGIRKALGATPASIIIAIVREALLITAVAGYIGLVAGLGLLEAADRFIPENDYIYNPNVDLRIVLAVTVLVIAAGTLAGFIPAYRAAKVDPVVALQD
ncbi:MAG: ABC transporter permease, partial [Gammaproteobacteria bacterium]